MGLTHFKRRPNISFQNGFDLKYEKVNTLVRSILKKRHKVAFENEFDLKHEKVNTLIHPKAQPNLKGDTSLFLK